uniref:Phosphoribulokinase/uridine kinase domain-containing protein n=1 Tax=Aureoumbra lagunensis TaxID=44058 RepID=A0A7S3K4X6_9STRA|mmetsp:Transcript_19471/g.25224  ORF Transcript_19471/g.25224 Transcript_19471/m.25224 type:complete len:284 (+) Transcript_19471:42-893(+)
MMMMMLLNLFLLFDASSGLVFRELHRSTLTVRSAKSSDAAMHSTYQKLADRALSNLADNKQYWIGIAGGPGSGKSTVAERVVHYLENAGIKSVAIPMDGYHFSKAILCELDPPNASTFMPRRGAPFTFDGPAFVRDLRLAKKRQSFSFPTYSRELSDPIPNGVQLEPHHQIILVEGNYLFLESIQKLKSLPYSERQEAKRWIGLLELFDDRWFIIPQGGLEEQRRRLIERHLVTWTDAKTIAWEASTPREGATKRTDFNDLRNAQLVDYTKDAAHLVVYTTNS